ncbi:DUF4397 domain-containing protein [Luteipulveratus flavus]|uniref:DUF4397 domain-containing protein n=1 Tax=Luteipulveratus flavus TaxID=3031728 RepID=A0ABT6C4N5_9MICO|nr:DUF4397 domain-containing protein [Luteipulveratus sp. YIM 133296]MDF8263911.1 DUF4397 domain-containing protein [Luteipulveratus sp. YIM 133296]
MVTARGRFLLAAVVGTGVIGGPLLIVGPADAAAPAGTVYLVQGVAGTSASMTVDGQVVAKDAAAKSIVGPLRLAPGEHTLGVTVPGTAAPITARIQVPRTGSLDAIVHRQVDPKAAPVVTTYANDVSAVAGGSSRLVVAHTAAVGPADVRVKGKVLFSNIANGEALTLTVPAGTYPVDIVPVATTGPAVLGPVDLKVSAGKLTRVFAIGVAATGSMDAVVQEIPVPTRGSGKAPSHVNAGTGGQAQGLIDASRDNGRTPQIAWYAGVLAVGGAAFAVRRRRASR